MTERSRETSREEDYRDYEERDLDDGWPYADLDAGAIKRNEAYGRSPAGLESNGNPGAEIASDPAIRSEGGLAVSADIAREAIDDDALEDAINDRLSELADIDERQIAVSVRDGVAKLTGEVDTVVASARAAQITASVPGVRAVYNLLVPIGLDSHIPGDATD